MKHTHDQKAKHRVMINVQQTAGEQKDKVKEKDQRDGVIQNENKNVSKKQKQPTKKPKQNKKQNKGLKSNKAAGITIAKAKRELNKPISVIDPGPCSYEAVAHKNNQSVSFTKSKGHNTTAVKQQCRIGPGFYYIEDQVKGFRNSEFTMGSRYQSFFEVKNKQIPGPGDYDLTLPHIAASRTKKVALNKGFGSASRFISPSIMPGPGDYQIPLKNLQSLNKKRTISNAGRESASKHEQSPGPGMYENLSSFDMSLKKKKGFVMVHKNVKRTTEQDLTSEAYNKYEVKREFQSQYEHAPAFTIGHQKRKFTDITNSLNCQEPKSSSTHLKRLDSKNSFTPIENNNQMAQQNTKYTFSKAKQESVLILKRKQSSSSNPNNEKQGLYSKFKKFQKKLEKFIQKGNDTINFKQQQKVLTPAI